MKVPIAVKRVEDTPAFQEETDVDIIGHSDATVHLNRLGGCQVCGFTDFCLGETGNFGAITIVFVQRLQGLEQQ